LNSRVAPRTAPSARGFEFEDEEEDAEEALCAMDMVIFLSGVSCFWWLLCPHALAELRARLLRSRRQTEQSFELSEDLVCQLWPEPGHRR
jgi:hypothetical protein